MGKDEVARHLGVSVGAVDRYTKRGRLSIRMGSADGQPAYDEAEVRRLKEEMEARAQAVRRQRRTLSLEEAVAVTCLPREEVLGRAIDGRLRARWCGSAVRLSRTEVEALAPDLE
jgi:hypothetical protein